MCIIAFIFCYEFKDFKLETTVYMKKKTDKYKLGNIRMVIKAYICQFFFHAMCTVVSSLKSLKS